MKYLEKLMKFNSVLISENAKLEKVYDRLVKEDIDSEEITDEELAKLINEVSMDDDFEETEIVKEEEETSTETTEEETSTEVDDKVDDEPEEPETSEEDFDVKEETSSEDKPAEQNTSETEPDEDEPAPETEEDKVEDKVEMKFEDPVEESTDEDADEDTSPEARILESLLGFISENKLRTCLIDKKLMTEDEDSLLKEGEEVDECRYANKFVDAINEGKVTKNDAIEMLSEMLSEDEIKQCMKECGVIGEDEELDIVDEDVEEVETEFTSDKFEEEIDEQTEDSETFKEEDEIKEVSEDKVPDISKMFAEQFEELEAETIPLKEAEGDDQDEDESEEKEDKEEKPAKEAPKKETSKKKVAKD